MPNHEEVLSESSNSDILKDDQFYFILPNSYKDNSISVNNSSSLPLLHLSRDHLYTIDSFASGSTSAVSQLPPLYEAVFNADSLMNLQQIYISSYIPINIVHFSSFYHKFGQITIAGDLIGSHIPGSNNVASSVVMAFWPGRGDS